MVQYRLGYFATSLCGHDKGRLYMVVKETGDMVGLCDGTHRCLNNPKMKKKKHVQIVYSHETAELFHQMISRTDADNWIKEMVKEKLNAKESSTGISGTCSNLKQEARETGTCDDPDGLGPCNNIMT